MKLFSALNIFVFLLAFRMDAFAVEPQCNDLLSGLSSELKSSIHDLAKLRFDLDRRLALGEDDAVVRALRSQYQKKEEEILVVTQIDREVLLSTVRTEIESLQKKLNIEEAQKVRQKEAQKQRVVELQTRVTEIGSLQVARAYHVQSELPNGQVVVVGGDSALHGDGALTSIEIIDPNTGKSRHLGDLKESRFDHEQSVLSDDQLLVTGGTSKGRVQRDSIELVNLKTGESKIIGHLKEARSDHTQSILPDGRVMVVGGYGDTKPGLTSIEVIDPKTGKSEIIGHLTNARAYHTQTVLEDGRVMVLGGSDDYTYPTSIEVIDPNTGKTEVIGHLKEPRRYHSQSLLPDGRVVIVGGEGVTRRAAAVEIIDPQTGTSKKIGLVNLTMGHRQKTLSNGKVVLIGGAEGKVRVNSVILLNPINGESRVVTTLKQTRNAHGLSILDDEKMLIAGGRTDEDQALGSIEVIRVNLDEVALPEGDE